MGIRRGFLQHRRRQLQGFGGMPGAVWLFFGCRRESEDFLYRADFEGFEKDGTLSQLHVAYSRAQVGSLFDSPALQHGPVASGPCLLPLTKSTLAAAVGLLCDKVLALRLAKGVVGARGFSGAAGERVAEWPQAEAEALLLVLHL